MLLYKCQWAEIPPYEERNIKSSFHVYLLRINGISEKIRDKIIQSVFDKKVAVNVHFIPLPMMTYYRNAGYQMENYPVSYDNYAREISLPVYYNLTDDMVQTVIKAVVQSVEDNI